jgi:2-polyprenyl-3-methyl-5-hydroxy-6-metoxy-1,4-benzoquinol methylase
VPIRSGTSCPQPAKLSDICATIWIVLSIMTNYRDLTMSEAGGKSHSKFAAGATWLRAGTALVRHAVTRVVTSLIPASMLARGTYRRDAVLPQSWEDEYGSGKWSYMNGLHELGRYSIIVGYCGFFKADGAILDVGCGEGILQQKLAPTGYRRYLGIDLSEVALAKAMFRADQRTEFQLGNIESFTPEGKFDIIIFNEILYYCSNPTAVIRRLACCLEPDGVMIASIWTSPRGRRKALQIWRMLDAIAEVMDSTTAANRETWTIKVFRPTKVNSTAVERPER